jgi:membrane associated rhomboid family serine protease
MTLVKAIAIGVVVAIIVAVIWVVGNLWVPVYLAELTCRVQPDCYASAGAGYVDSGSTLLAALVGFGGGFYWSIRHNRRRQLSVSK